MTTPSADSTPPPAGPRARRLAALLAVGAAVAALAVVVSVVVVVVVAGGGSTIEVIVPEGTQARIDAGEQIELLPRVLEVSVGDRILIVNEDGSPHQVGPYIVGPGQRIEQEFAAAGRIEGVCTLHPSGEVSIVVR